MNEEEKTNNKNTYKIKTIYISNILYLIFAIILLWTLVSSTIQSFKCESLTQTQIFKNIPNSFVMNWYECDKKF